MTSAWRTSSSKDSTAPRISPRTTCRSTESIGVKYGADLNANTGFDETEYILPVPSDKPNPRAFDILQDWAMGDKFESSEVVDERGVIMGEWRSGPSARARASATRNSRSSSGSKYAVRLPIGDTGIIEHATAAPLKRFYHDWYRPDLMAVIAVGDFPVDSIVALIRNQLRRDDKSGAGTPAGRRADSDHSGDARRDHHRSGGDERIGGVADPPTIGPLPDRGR